MIIESETLRRRCLNGYRIRICQIWFVLVACAMIAACSDGATQVKLYRISGSLNRQGQPVPNLIIYFVPAEGRPSTGLSGPDGRFTLNYQKDRPGAVPGEHKVWVKYHPTTPAEEMQLREGTALLPPELTDAIQKYGSAETSSLKVVISGDKSDLVISLD